MVRLFNRIFGSGKSLVAVSCTLLATFAGLFYFDAVLKDRLNDLSRLTIAAERILVADLQSTTAVRLSASLQSDRYVLNYQDYQDTKYGLLEEISTFGKSPQVQEYLSRMEDVQADIEDAETEAIALIDEEEWEKAHELVTEPAFGRQKGIYRANLSSAPREMILDSERRAENADLIFQVMQAGVLVTFLILATIGITHSRILRRSLTAQMDLAHELESVNAGLEQRVLERTSALADQEERMRSLLEVSPIGFILVRPSGDILLTNNALKKNLQYPSDDEVAIDIEQLYVNAQDRDRYLEILQRDGVVAGFETRWKRLDGTHFWLTISSKLIDYDGERAIPTWIDDITPRKEASEELAEKEALLRLTFETIADGIYVVDKDQNFVLFNDRYCEYIGVPEGSVEEGGPLERVVRMHAKRGDYGQGDTDELVERRLTALANPEFIQSELAIADGSRILETRKAPMDGGGAVVILSDVTARKEAEAEIAKQKAFLESTMESMDQGIIMYDENWNIMAHNERARHLWGYSADVLRVGATSAELVEDLVRRGELDEDGKDSPATVKARMESRQSHVVERELSNGIVLEVRRRATPEGGYVSTQTDITERKKAEQEIAAKESQLRIAMENMPGAMFVVDRDLKIVLMNEAYKEFYGDPDNLLAIGASVRDVLRSEAERGMLSGDGTIDEIVEERIKSYDIESAVNFEDRTPDGRHIQLTRTPAPGGMTVSVAVDITERKKAEARIVESRRLLQDLVNQLPNALALRDQEGGMLMTNRTFRNWYIPDDAEDTEILGSTDADWRTEDAARQVSEIGARLLAGEDTEPLEIDQHFKDGTPLSTLVHSFILKSADGTPTAVGTVDIDITERKKAEAEIKDAHGVMRDSIQYASRIQRSLLPDPKVMRETSPDHFCLWEPRDIVGGDMYWVRQDRRGYFIALFDCTGHGVPGALMTTIAVSALNIAFAETADPARLISRVNQIVKHMLGQENEEGLSDDGLEMGVCHVEPERMRMTYSGAKFELISMIGTETEVIKGDKSGLGYRHVDFDRRFTNHNIRLRPGQKFYMYTDGITDQIEGNRRRSFGRKRLLRLLEDISVVPMKGQESAIAQAFADYQGGESRRDDVSMIGFMPVR